MIDSDVHAWIQLLPRDVRFVRPGEPSGPSASPEDTGDHRVLVLRDRAIPSRDLDQFFGVVALGGHAHSAGLLRDRGFSHVHDFVVLPRGGSPRFFLPPAPIRVLRRAVELTATDHVGRAARFAQAVALAAGRGVVGRRIVLATRDRSPLERWIGEQLAASDVRLAISNGTPGAYRKITLQVMAPRSGMVLGYVKRAISPLGKLALANERQCLSHLAATADLVGAIPSVRATCSDDDSVSLLLSAGPARPGPKHFGPSHRDFLRRLAGASTAGATFKTSAARRELFDGIAELETGGVGEWPGVLAELLAQVDRRLESAVLPMPPAHRDFVPWNTRQRRDGGLFVFDWEFGRTAWLPLADMFHFHVLPEVLSQQPQASLWERFRTKWTACAVGMGVSNTFVLPLYGAYLADVVLFYLSSRLRVGDAGDDRVPNRLRGEIVRLLPLLATESDS